MRITQLPTGTQASTDYIAVDNTSNGTRKIPVGDISSTINSPSYANGILDYALNVAPLGASVVSVRNIGAVDLPNTSYIYSTASIMKRGSTVISVSIIPDGTDLPPIINSYTGSWGGWRYSGSYYASSATNFDNFINSFPLNYPALFGLGAAPTSSIFGIGVYQSTGHVVKYSSTEARGTLASNGNYYVFNYNPSTSTVSSIKRLVDATEAAIVMNFGTVNNSTITINVSGSTRFILTLCGTADTRTGAYLVTASATSAYIYPLGSAPSSITINTATAGKIKVTNSASGSAFCFGVVLSGAEYLSV